VNKKGPFYNLLDSSRPDVIITTETWFHDEIVHSKYFDSEHFAFIDERECQVLSEVEYSLQLTES